VSLRKHVWTLPTVSGSVQPNPRDRIAGVRGSPGRSATPPYTIELP
jgi:hypothetical protein